MKKILILVACLLFVSCAPVFGEETEMQMQKTLDPEEQKCFDAINKFRAKYRYEPIQLDESICEACRLWSEKLRGERRLYHGSTGENCARGNTDGYLTFRQWLKSTKGHREFMKNRNMDTGGIGRSWLSLH
jgi:uncharacterized protein YkwD